MKKTIFDQLAATFSSAPYKEEYEQARSFYFSTIGNIFEDNPLFDTHITGFLEVYLFERPLNDYGIPPVRLYENLHTSELSDEQKACLKSMRESRRSIFEILHVDHGRLKVLDVIKNKTYEHVHYVDNIGMEKGQLIDARLFISEQEKVFSESLWIHASQTKPHILRELKKLNPFTVVYDIAYMKWRRDHFPNAPLEQTYSENSLKFRKYGSVHANGVDHA